MGASSDSRQIYWRTVFILALLLIIVTGAGFYTLYRMTLDDRQSQLLELARAQTRIMESVARFNAYFMSGEIQGIARSSTLSQFKEGHRAFRGFGKTGEIMLAERIGDEIVFLLPARNLDFRIPPPINLMAAEAGPMEAAVSGASGSMVDFDYTGHKVLAAYEWMPFLEMGMVVKMDMAEINQPFIRAGLLTAALALLAILIGAALNARAVSPLIERIVRGARTIAEKEASYRQLVETIPGVVYQAEAGEQMKMRELSGAVMNITGRPAADFVNNSDLIYAEMVLPEDRPGLVPDADGPFSLDYRILWPDGEVRWVSDHGSITVDEQGLSIRNGILLDISRRKEAEIALEELPRKLSRYISPQVYKSIFQGQQDAQVGSTRKKLTVFFSDVVNFTVKSESLDPDDLSFIINSYLNRMSELAIKHGGTLDKFIGDGVVIFFGDPESHGVRQDALNCLNMALDMLGEIKSLNRLALDQGINSPLEIRIGIATGFCTVGNFGSESRMDYTVLGKTVNLAARLESAAPSHAILVSEETAMLIEEEFVCEPVEPVQVKGFEKPVPVSLVREKRGGN